MKKPLVLALALGGGVSTAFAVDIAKVLSATPVVQQVAVPRQVCSNQEVAVQQPKSGAGAVVGAMVGGALGNAAGGHGGGRAAATVLGAVGGSLLGDRLEGSPEPELRSVQRCSTQSTYENRTVAYNVVYEFAGKQYTAQMQHDPGPTLALQIGPAEALRSEPQQGYAADIPVYTDPAPVVVTQPNYQAYPNYPNYPSYQSYPAYPAYAPRPYYYPPVTLEFGFGSWGHGYRGGYRGHRRWH